jgi:PhnB protein
MACRQETNYWMILPHPERGRQRQEIVMAIKHLNPYLNFDGTAQKAIALYERALGAKIEHLQRFGDMPGNKQSPENAQRVMHAALRIGPDQIMISDTQPGMPFTVGNNNHICLDFDDPADMAARFDALAAGGSISMPLQDTFWGAKFGMLQDAYGVRWMFNYNHPKA